MTDNDIIRTSTDTSDRNSLEAAEPQLPAGRSVDAILTDADLDEVVGGRSRTSTASKKSSMYNYAMYKL